MSGFCLSCLLIMRGVISCFLCESNDECSSSLPPHLRLYWPGQHLGDTDGVFTRFTGGGVRLMQEVKLINSWSKQCCSQVAVVCFISAFQLLVGKVCARIPQRGNPVFYLCTFIPLIMFHKAIRKAHQLRRTAPSCFSR